MDAISLHHYLERCHNKCAGRRHHTNNKCQLIDTLQSRAVLFVVFRDKAELIIPNHNGDKTKEGTGAQKESKNTTFRWNPSCIADGGKKWIHMTVANGNTVCYNDGNDGADGE